MESVRFFSSPGVLPERRWVDTNQALGGILAKAADDLLIAKEHAHSIWLSLQSLNPIMAELCRLSCPWCPNPCCIVNRTWYDFQDLLYLHLTGQRLPPGQVNAGGHTPCRYLGPRGCRVPRNSRPWACTVYLCGVQQRCLARLGGAAAGHLSRTVDSIRRVRHDLEDAVTKAVTAHRSQRRNSCTEASGHLPRTPYGH